MNTPWSESSDNAVSTEAVQALLGGHGVLQHIQANGTHELAVQAAWGHGYFQTIRDGLLEKQKNTEAAILVKVQTPTLSYLHHITKMTVLSLVY